MTTIAPLNATALQILLQSNVPAAVASEPAPAAVLAVANGIKVPGVSDAQSQAKARMSESLFDKSVVNIQELKVNLMQRLGEELGVAMDEYKDDPRGYASALRVALAIAKSDSEDGGVKLVAELEEKLGLDRLGISLDELIAAVDDPDGEADEKLDAALRKETNEDAKDALRALKTNADDLYGI